MFFGELEMVELHDGIMSVRRTQQRCERRGILCRKIISLERERC